MGPERDRDVADLTRGRTLAAVALCFALLGGCGEDEEPVGSDVGLPAAGGGGTLNYVVPELPRSLDPLTAPNGAAQIVTRQVHEPLIATVDAPYDSGARQPGLALSLKPSAHRTVWRAQLRSGVRFQDGTPFNASAVLANARRWAASSAGRRLLPDLFAVDAPRPKEVRFQFERPPGPLRNLLSWPIFGIVSPDAIDERGRVGRIRPSATGTGTGAFTVSEASSGRIALSRSPEWWGTPMGMGPALDAIDFTAVSAERERVQLLALGQAQVAEAVGDYGVTAAEADPLLRVVPAGGGLGVRGLRASVRGFEPGPSGAPDLSGVWLTTIGG